MNAQLLKWDSDQLGFSVAKIIPASLSPEVLAQVLNDLRKQNVKLVYWCSNREDAASRQAASDCQGILVDEKTTYAIDLYGKIFSYSTQVSVFDQPEPTLELINLAFQVGRESRFYLDKKMPRDAYKKIYRAWIKNSVNHKVADCIFVTRDADKITGFLTLVKKSDYGNIALIAVDPTHQGQGLGSALLTSAKAWCVEQGYSRCEVVTQKSNQAACALYEKNGFSVKRVDDFYHFWL